MAIRRIAQLGEPVLRRPAEEVPLERLSSHTVQSLIDDMIETMRDADGVGIAAPQVYESLRLCVVEVEESSRYPGLERIPLSVYVNPRIEPLVSDPSRPKEAESIFMYEGCLSVQGLRGRVQRPRKVRLRARDRMGQPMERVFEGVTAAVIQHEVDHLNGTLFVDRAAPRTLTFLREYQRHVPPEERMIDGALRMQDTPERDATATR